MGMLDPRDEVAREITARWPRDRSAHLEPHTYHMKSHSYKLRLLTMTTTYMCQGRARGRCPGVSCTQECLSRGALSCRLVEYSRR